MFNVNDIKNGMTILFEDNIYTVLEFSHVKPGKGGAFPPTSQLSPDRLSPVHPENNPMNNSYSECPYLQSVLFW